MTTSRPTPYTPAVPLPPQIASESVAAYGKPTLSRAVKLFRNGANQAVRIPKEFELPGTQALMHREGNRLILELVPDQPKKGTAAALAVALLSMKDWPVVDAPFPDADEGLAPLDEIDL